MEDETKHQKTSDNDKIEPKESGQAISETGTSPPAETLSKLSAWIQFPRRVLLLLIAYGLARLIILGLRSMTLQAALDSLATRQSLPLWLVQSPEAWTFSWVLSERTPISEILSSRLPNTLTLLGATLVMGALLSVAATAVALLIHKLGEKNEPLRSTLKGLGRLVVFPQISVPVFWFAWVIIVFSLMLMKLGLPSPPIGGAISLEGRNAGGLFDRLVHLIMPTLLISILPAALTAQAAVRELTRPRQAGGHRSILGGVFKGAATLLGQIGAVLGMILVVEIVFAYPGIGRVLLQATSSLDLPMVFGALTIVAGLVLLGQIMAEFFRWLGRLVQPQSLIPWSEPTPWGRQARKIWGIVTLSLLLIPALFVLLRILQPALAPPVPVGAAVTKVGLMYDPLAVNPSDSHLWPGVKGYPLGTDEIGRDVASRLVFGAGNSLLGAGLAAVLATILGGLVGALAAWLTSIRTWWSETLADVVLLPAHALIMLPLLLLLIALAPVLVPPASTLTGQIVTLAVLTALVLLARATRAYQALRAAAPSESRRWVRWLSGLGALFLSNLFFGLATMETLNFLGLGVQPPYASLGNMLTRVQDYLFLNPILMWWPGLVLWLFSLVIYTAADALIGRFHTKDIMARMNT